MAQYYNTSDGMRAALENIYRLKNEREEREQQQYNDVIEELKNNKYLSKYVNQATGAVEAPELNLWDRITPWNTGREKAAQAYNTMNSVRTLRDGGINWGAINPAKYKNGQSYTKTNNGSNANQAYLDMLVKKYRGGV